jgi:hypothetical protein
MRAPRHAAELDIPFYLRKPVDLEQLQIVVESYCSPSQDEEGER